MACDAIVKSGGLCLDDLCHSGSQTLCGAWREDIEASFGDDWEDDDWADAGEETNDG